MIKIKKLEDFVKPFYKKNIMHNLLKTQNLPEEKINKIVKVAWEFQKDIKPETIEGKILHDAHLIEGGKTFLI